MSVRMKGKLQDRVWWKYLSPDLRELLEESALLSEMALRWNQKFSDYSFIVFPAAKAYEGFLKKIFLDCGFIGPEDYNGKHFRIGKALNPSLEEKFRNESVYDKVKTYCRNDRLADMMWETWKNGRNLIFHWFPNEKNAISYEEAGLRLQDIVDTIEETYAGCPIGKSDKIKSNDNL